MAIAVDGLILGYVGKICVASYRIVGTGTVKPRLFSITDIDMNSCKYQVDF